MGQNLVKEEGLDSFGIITRNKEFMHPPTLGFLVLQLNMQHDSCFIRLQHAWINCIENPSSVGALSSSSPQISHITSSSSISLTNSLLSSSKTNHVILCGMDWVASNSSSSSNMHRFLKWVKASSFSLMKPDILSPLYFWISWTLLFCWQSFDCLDLIRQCSSSFL